MASDRHVVITGMMGVGKSTTAKVVALSLGLPVRDSDDDIEAVFGQTGAEIAAEQGIGELHSLEAAVLIGALGAPEASVISAAASVIEHAACRVALKRRSFVVFLEAPVDELVLRASTAKHRRTIDRENVVELVARRTPIFHGQANLILDACRPTAELRDEILRHLH